jgi:pimeloyl-ACP methyl ester carboxylesterase
MINFVHNTLDKKNLIIFIHGFIGSEETWIKKDGSRPLIDYIIKDEAIFNNFNIALFEYHTRLLDLFPQSNAILNFLLKNKNPINLPINELSKLLESRIQYTCADYENIILIGHSMGGLVAKRFILDDLKKNTDSKVKLYVSLATPHSGSIIANFGKLLINNVQTKDLSALSESISSMNNEWVQNKNLPKRIYGQGAYDKIVSKESSIALDADSQKVIYSDDDHFSIIVPETKNVIVDALIIELNDFLKQQQIQSIENHEKFSDEGQYDEEIFVLKLIMADIHTTLLSSSKMAFYNAEFTLRKLYSLNVDLNTLEPLYTKIQELYFIEFGELLKGVHKNPDELLTAVHKRIREEDKIYLNSLYQPLQSLQKFGMLQQLAGKDNSIWWDKTHDEKNFEEFKKALDKD